MLWRAHRVEELVGIVLRGHQTGLGADAASAL